MAKIKEAERCQVGKTKDGKYQVWHKVMGENTPPKFVEREQVLDTIDALLDEFKLMSSPIRASMSGGKRRL